MFYRSLAEDFVETFFEERMKQELSLDGNISQEQQCCRRLALHTFFYRVRMRILVTCMAEMRSCGQYCINFEVLPIDGFLLYVGFAMSLFFRTVLKKFSSLGEWSPPA